MKSTMEACFAALCALLLFSGPAQGAQQSDRTITQVVKLLQHMLDKSKADGDEERNLYAKYKCYCDTNEADKKASIAALTEKISLLESNIEELQASTAALSEELAKLDADITANKDAQKEATSIRDKEKATFDATKKDFSSAIDATKEAIKVLAEVGADQTLGQAAADHSQFMSGYRSSLLKLKATVKRALIAASFTVSTKQAAIVDSFLQAPFTGTYSAQSAEVVGILKDMRDTFERNLQTAIATEEAAVKAYKQYMKALGEALVEMETSRAAKQGQLSANDSALSTKKEQLSAAIKQKDEDEQFLNELIDMCSVKAKEYHERTLLRTNEEAAISEAIAILNSDAAFETFGTVGATSTGKTSFLQRVSIHKHKGASSAEDVPRQKARALLRKAASSNKSIFLVRIAAMLEANNPFAVVLEKIDEIIALIGKEEKADDEQLEWCYLERNTSTDNLKEKESQIATLESAIEGLTTIIDDPKTGLKAQIAEDEASLQTNSASQASETEDRKEASLAYEKDIQNLVEAENLLTRAVSVLKAYYSKILKEAAFVSVKQSPEPPATWEGPYKGQSASGGTDAIDMMEFILKNTKAEETEAHDAEKVAQSAFEDSMARLKEEEKSLQESLAGLRLSLAETEEELMGKKSDLKTTTAEKLALEEYLLKIKPGCDFITTNIDLRKGNRKDELEALETASKLLEESPAYQTYLAEAHNETLGDCLSICAGDEENVNCKACRAKVSVPGYCAGHPGTDGC